MLGTFILLGCCCSFVLVDAQRRPQPGDYPSLRSIPRTSFDCKKRQVGYYADPDPATRCQVYHMCDMKGNKFSYLCPNGTLFHQQHLICAHWYQVNCTRTLELYKVNKHMFPFEKFDSGIVSTNYSTEYLVAIPGEAEKAPQSPNANTPIIHDVKLKESGWQVKPGNIGEQNGVNGETNVPNSDVHVPISSAQAILQSDHQAFQPSSAVSKVITQFSDQSTNAPKSPNYRGRTKFASARTQSQASVTSGTTLQQSRAATPTAYPRVPFTTDEPQTVVGQAEYGTKSVVSTDQSSVTRPLDVPARRRNKNIRNRAQQQPSQFPKFRAPSRVPSIRSSWEATLPLQPASSEREQYAVTMEELTTDSIGQLSTTSPQSAATTTPWISLRATQWPLVRQSVAIIKEQTQSTDVESQSFVTSMQTPLGESQSALESNDEKIQAKSTKLTMTFPKGGFFKKYSVLPLNEKCPLCNPYFLKNGQCFPCVTIR